MADLAYGQACAMSRIRARHHLVTTYQQSGGISETARRWEAIRTAPARGSAGWVPAAPSEMLRGSEYAFREDRSGHDAGSPPIV
jgi:hypothetical protein